MEPEPDISPTHIGGFRILRRLSSGATTDVLLARAEGPHGFERVVALKVLLQKFHSDPAFERMFAREASAYARLSHPAIVKLYDFFGAEGQLVMVLEYIDGLPLHKLRAMLSIGGERFEDSAALFIGSRIFAALGAAHSARDPENGEFAPVIHRDINPSNVLVPWDGHVKISDFGIAKIGGTQGDSRLGFVKGTYGYMAPEQVRGENVTVRADVYAASLVLWELLARRKAIQRGSLPEVEVLKAMAKPEFPPLDTLRPDISVEVRDAVRRGLEPNPDRRSITADEMAGILRLSMNGDEGRMRLAEAIARVRPPPTEDGLAITRAQPSHATLAGAPATPVRDDGAAHLPLDPDETARFSADALPEDSGAFKRAEVPALVENAKGYAAVDAPAGDDEEEEEAKSSGELTVIEARRPVVASDPPPTLPPSSEPGTLAPETLSLSQRERPEVWREPSQGFVRTEPTPNPQTLRFGPSQSPPAPQAPPPSVPRPSPSSRSGSKSTLMAAVPPPGGPSPDSPRTLMSPSTPHLPVSGTPPKPVAPDPVALDATLASDGSVRPAAAPPGPDPPTAAVAAEAPPADRGEGASKLASPAGEGPAAAQSPPGPELPLPRFPMPSGDAIAAAPAADAPVRPLAASLSTVRTRRKGSAAPLVVGVVLFSALAGVAAVEVYLRLASSDETHATSARLSPSAQPSPSTSAHAAAAATTRATTTAPVAPHVATSAAASATPPAASGTPADSSATVSIPAPAAAPSTAGPAASSSASAQPSATPAVATAIPAASAGPPAEPTARPAGSDPEASAQKQGEILTKPSVAGHRIYVDDRVVGNSPDPVSVHCGHHTVRVGSQGTPREVDIPCGGAIVVNP